MKIIIRTAVCFLLLLGITTVAQSHQTQVTEWMSVPGSSKPDACQSAMQNRENCQGWGYLTEISDPVEWKSDRYKDVHQRWYTAVVAKEKVIVHSGANGIRFDFDKSNIRAESLPILQADLPAVKDPKNKSIKIIGYTDSKGTDEYNQKLSERRANSVREYFISQGVDPSMITSEGRGETNPVAANTNPDGSDNPAGRSLNRRIEIRIN